MMMIHISSVSPMLLAIPLVLFLTSFIWGSRVLSAKKSAAAAAPPGPWKLPIIGNLHQLMFSRVPALHIRLRELAQRYGPVMSLQIGEMRKICIVELLSARRVASFRSVREEEVSTLISRIRAAAAARDEEGVDLREMLFSFTSNVTYRSAFGTLQKTDKETFMAVVERIAEALGGFGLSDLFPSLKFIPVITGYQAKLMTLHQRADSLLEKIIEKHRVKADRKRQQHSDDDDDDDEIEDIVDILLNLQRTGGLQLPLTTDDIKAVILDVFIGALQHIDLTKQSGLSISSKQLLRLIPTTASN
ncbi:unnamed protein product [Linum trigynum]|uniref:Cytochrome P450 n=1 Tax=Linum trigynum TaxID=586398 RepID=A0AAV2ESI1_9ROSI